MESWIRMGKLRSFVFCTAFASKEEVWSGRYRRWIDAIKGSNLIYDQILLIDDGSPVLPDWKDVLVINIIDGEIPTVPEGAKIVLLHFDQNLGRQSMSDFPGWYRSFCFAGKYAVANNYSKIMHIESDSFLISRRIQFYFNQVDEGWTAFWCRRWTWPETALQIIAGRSVAALAEQDILVPHEKLVGKWMELSLPFTRVEARFNGDRFGEYLTYIPRNADFAVQTLQESDVNYFWWMQKHSYGCTTSEPAQRPLSDLAPNFVSNPCWFESNIQETVAVLADALSCGLFFETTQGVDSVFGQLKCDTLALVDLRREQIREISSVDALGRRQVTLTFLMSSIEFFKKYELSSLLQGRTIDFAFLNGRHLFQIALREFIEVEKLCGGSSTVALGSCLPLTSRMAEQSFRLDESESSTTRFYWTGDVWKLIPILMKYRPEMELTVLNCAPAGLVLCRNLNQFSTILEENYDYIVNEFSTLPLNMEFLQNKVSESLLDVRWLLQDHANIDQLFGGSYKFKDRARRSDEANQT